MEKNRLTLTEKDIKSMTCKQLFELTRKNFLSCNLKAAQAIKEKLKENYLQ